MDLITSKKLLKDSTDQSQALTPSAASQYIAAVKAILFEDYSSPSPDLIQYFINRLPLAIRSEKTVDQFHTIVKIALKEFVDECVSDRLQLDMSADQKDVERSNQAPDVCCGKKSGLNRQDNSIKDEDFEKFFVVDVT
ncbi:hypothetical protein [Desulforhopalus sp. IMCC35007]|uniref:hypothetical protein n=1 Tax=Desulforhopalus sp. IMCC35007 TaxID=2569543 RepID=UPI0010ADE1FD|nr:hypothetical protein [Desulforhopalus sp. IMCC35007]TKB06144.1 hypothetical protein FCL48_22030 [Desulforhopalus sp. IMCC35007]